MKYRLTKLLYEVILNESIDIYDLNKLKESTNYQIKKEDKENFQVIFSPKESPNKYQFKIEYDKDDMVMFGEFGIIQGDKISTTKQPKDKYVLNVLSTVFSLLRYYLDKYNIKKLKFEIEPGIKDELYNLYLKKHFNDYNIKTEGEYFLKEFTLVKKDGK